MYRKDPSNRTPILRWHKKSVANDSSLSNSKYRQTFCQRQSRLPNSVRHATICGKYFQIAFGSMHIGYRFCSKWTVRYEGQLGVRVHRKSGQCLQDYEATGRLNWHNLWSSEKWTPPPPPTHPPTSHYHLNMNMTVSRYNHLQKCYKLIM